MVCSYCIDLEADTHLFAGAGKCSIISQVSILFTKAQGKTLTMLALILATKKDVDDGFSNSTLIGKNHAYVY